MTYLRDVRAPRVVLVHDRDDVVIPVGESRRLRDALVGRGGVRYTEFTVFQHLDPSKGNPSPVPLARDLARFGWAIYALFRGAALGALTASGRVGAADRTGRTIASGKEPNWSHA